MALNVRELTTLANACEPMCRRPSDHRERRAHHSDHGAQQIATVIGCGLHYYSIDPPLFLSILQLYKTYHLIFDEALHGNWGIPVLNRFYNQLYIVYQFDI